MSSFLCFICHSTVNSDTPEEMREKYRDVIGMNLCPDSHLCHICCHVLNKLWLFKSVCLKRSLEYPVLFSEKGTLNLQRNDLEVHILCSDEICDYHNVNINCKSYHFVDHNDNISNDCNISNQYVELEDDRTDFDEYFQPEEQQSYDNDNVINDANDYCHEGNDTTNNDDVNDYCDEGNDVTNNDDVNDFSDQGNNVTNNDDSAINKYNSNNDIFNGEEIQLSNSETKICDNKIYNDNQENVNSPTPNDVNHNEDNGGDEDLGNKRKKRKKKEKKKKKQFTKTILTLEQQKAELEQNRKSKKYLEAEFKCYNCALGFLFKDTYQAHMMRHEESNGEYRCGVCTLRFACAGVLRAHGAGHAERHVCGACGARVGARRTRAHAARCDGRPPPLASCHHCGSVFTDASGLRKHLKRFHQTNTSHRTYPCSVCGKSCPNQAAVRTHMLTHVHRKFSCDQCPSTFSSPYSLTQHKKKHSSVDQGQHYCATCGISYSSRKSLLGHRRKALVHQQTVYSCPVCGRVCANRVAMATHVSRVHGPPRPRAPPRPLAPPAPRSLCHSCGNTFHGNSKLNRHLKEVCEKDKLEQELSSYYL